MAGVYIHIPFCRQACHYCNFHFTTSLLYKPALVAAILQETELQKEYLKGESLSTIYIGGGTPSLCTKDELRSILAKLKESFIVEENAEVTLEVNPDDISSTQLISWKDIGITRLSIGVQSIFEEDLRWMNRAHTAKQALENVQLARKYFDNITIDLIYGTPLLTDEKWKANVDFAVSMEIPHLSCYALTVEQKTPLEKMIRLKKTAPVESDGQSAQFLLLMKWLAAAGYEHYEISNFAKPGFRSKHNSSYWQGKKYLGLGPSAHSFNGQERQWNVSNNTTYINSLQQSVVPFEKEVLTETQRLNEYIMTALRTIEGIDLGLFNNEQELQLIRGSKRYTDTNLMVYQDRKLVLTDEGKLLADGIAADLFF